MKTLRGIKKSKRLDYAGDMAVLAGLETGDQVRVLAIRASDLKHHLLKDEDRRRSISRVASAAAISTGQEYEDKQRVADELFPYISRLLHAPLADTQVFDMHALMEQVFRPGTILGNRVEDLVSKGVSSKASDAYLKRKRFNLSCKEVDMAACVNRKLGHPWKLLHTLVAVAEGAKVSGGAGQRARDRGEQCAVRYAYALVEKRSEIGDGDDKLNNAFHFDRRVKKQILALCDNIIWDNFDMQFQHRYGELAPNAIGAKSGFLQDFHGTLGLAYRGMQAYIQETVPRVDPQYITERLLDIETYDCDFHIRPSNAVGGYWGFRLQAPPPKNAHLPPVPVFGQGAENHVAVTRGRTLEIDFEAHMAEIKKLQWTRPEPPSGGDDPQTHPRAGLVCCEGCGKHIFVQPPAPSEAAAAEAAGEGQAAGIPPADAPAVAGAGPGGAGENGDDGDTLLAQDEALDEARLAAAAKAGVPLGELEEHTALARGQILLCKDCKYVKGMRQWSQAASENVNYADSDSEQTSSEQKNGSSRPFGASRASTRARKMTNDTAQRSTRWWDKGKRRLGSLAENLKAEYLIKHERRTRAFEEARAEWASTPMVLDGADADATPISDRHSALGVAESKVAQLARWQLQIEQLTNLLSPKNAAMVPAEKRPRLEDALKHAQAQAEWYHVLLEKLPAALRDQHEAHQRKVEQERQRRAAAAAQNHGGGGDGGAGGGGGGGGGTGDGGGVGGTGGGKEDAHPAAAATAAQNGAAAAVHTATPGLAEAPQPAPQPAPAPTPTHEAAAAPPAQDPNGGIPRRKRVPLDVNEQYMTFDELIQERSMWWLGKDFIELLGVYEALGDSTLLLTISPEAREYLDALKKHAGGDFSNLTGFSNPRGPAVKRYADPSWFSVRNTPIASGLGNHNSQTSQGTLAMLRTLLHHKFDFEAMIESSTLPAICDPDRRPAAGNMTGDELTNRNARAVVERLIAQGTQLDSSRARRMAHVVAGAFDATAQRPGDFHLEMNAEELAEKPLEAFLPSYQRAVNRKDTISHKNVSKHVRRSKHFTDQLLSSRNMAGFLEMMTLKRCPPPAELFPRRALDVRVFARLADAMLGGAEGSEEEKKIGAMQHLHGRQMNQTLGARREIGQSIREGDGEMLDALVLYLLPLMSAGRKSNYARMFCHHIITLNWDAFHRRYCFKQRQFVNDVSVRGHKNAMDAMIEALVGEQKRIARAHGLTTLFKTAKQGFFLTALRRMLSGQHGVQGRKPRAAFHAKSLATKAKLIALHLRSGLADADNMDKKWALETESLHALSHREGILGAAMSYENATAEMSAEVLRGFGFAGEAAGTFRAFRAQAGPNGKKALRLERLS